MKTAHDKFTTKEKKAAMKQALAEISGLNDLYLHNGTIATTLASHFYTKPYYAQTRPTA